MLELQRRYQWSQDEELQYWSGNIPTGRTFEEFRRTVAERDWPKDGKRMSFGVRDLDYQLVGMASCYGIDWDKRVGEMGIYLGERDMWNRGLGTDAVETLLQYLFLDLEFGSVYLHSLANNSRAIRSYEKAGFQKLETRRRFRPPMGYYQEVRMGIDRARYLERQRPALMPRVPTDLG
jgi:RimJ/RimL family protein N-acetyltransferase